MKSLFVSAWLLTAAPLVLAQAPAPKPEPSAPAAAKKAPVKAAPAPKVDPNKPQTKKTEPSKTAAKPAAKPAGKAENAKASPPSSRTQLRNAASQVASGFVAAEAALTPAELAIAEQVYVGRMPCELGAFVTVTAHEGYPGHFQVAGKGFKYDMTPVVTTTGTVRLEDRKAGAIWLQIANKSMLMNQKLGQRLADECMSPQQIEVAEAIKKNPPASVLEPLK